MCYSLIISHATMQIKGLEVILSVAFAFLLLLSNKIKSKELLVLEEQTFVGLKAMNANPAEK